MSQNHRADAPHRHGDMFTGFERWTDPDLRSPLGAGRKNKYFVCFDTNALLSLYKSGPDARREILDSFKKLDDRLFAPQETIREFWKNRATKINEQYKEYDDTRETLTNAQKSTNAKLKAWFKLNSTTSDPEVKEKVKDFTDRIDKLFAELLTEVESSKANFLDFPRYTLTKLPDGGDEEQEDAQPDATIENPTAIADPVVKMLSEILDGKVGPAPTPKKRHSLFDELKKASEKKRRPGVTDINKVAETDLGDYLIWQQILDEADRRKKADGDCPVDVILVTEEKKLDWWRNESYFPDGNDGNLSKTTPKGKTPLIGANPDLIEDYTTRIGGLPFIMDMKDFLEFARRDLGATISDATMEAARTSETETTVEIFYDGLRSLRSGDRLTAVYDFETRHYTVPEGGLMAGAVQPTLAKKQPGIVTLRQSLIEDGKVVENEKDPIYSDDEGNVFRGTYVFTEDHEFRSHNQMAAAVTGQFAFSRDRWMTANGTDLTSLIAEYDDADESDEE